MNMNQMDNGSNGNDVLAEKLNDAMTPGFEVEFDPEEAERAGAFQEDALSEADALDSCIDLTDEEPVAVTTIPQKPTGG
jgi:hypothetical protein